MWAASSSAVLAQSVPSVASPPATASASPVLVELKQLKVVRDERGNEQFVDAASVKPNDVIEYRAVYKNVSNRPVTQVSAELPFPQGLEYLPASAQPRKGVSFSATAGEYAAEPLMRRRADGQQEPVPYTQYRRARWTIGELAAGASTTVKARVKVESVQPLRSDPVASVAASRP